MRKVRRTEVVLLIQSHLDHLASNWGSRDLISSRLAQRLPLATPLPSLLTPLPVLLVSFYICVSIGGRICVWSWWCCVCGWCCALHIWVSDTPKCLITRVSNEWFLKTERILDVTLSEFGIMLVVPLIHRIEKCSCVKTLVAVWAVISEQGCVCTPVLCGHGMCAHIRSYCIWRQGTEFPWFHIPGCVRRQPHPSCSALPGSPHDLSSSVSP